MSPRARRALAAAVLGATLVFIALESRHAATDRFRSRGDAEHVVMAWNLWQHGVVSRLPAKDGAPRPTWRREPLYPALLAAVLALRGDPSQQDVACVQAADPRCLPLLRDLKKVNVLLLMALAIASWWATHEVLGGGPLAWLAFGLVVLNGAFWGLLDDFRTELAAALALLVASVCLHRIALGSRRAADVVGAGLAFGSLMLVKAVFFYVGAPVFALAVWLGLRPERRRAALRLAVALALAYAVAGVWMARNAWHGGGFRIAEDRAVLAIRAEYDTMSWREWGAAWFYYSRGFPPSQWILERGFAPGDWQRLVRENPDGFYRRAKRNAGAAAERLGLPARPKPAALQRAAREVILERFPMHVAVTAPLAVQACFGYERYFTRWPVRVLLHATAFLLMPALLLATAVLLVRRDPARVAFYLPAAACFALHAAATHNIPRYAWPLIPVATIALFALPGILRGGGRVSSAARGV
jgi:hypothetical protein